MIAIFTDFGIQGPYLGQMKAVLHSIAPAVPVVDIFSDLPAFNIQAAAYLLPAYSQYLPANSVCLCVVDPGVGSERRALMIRSQQRWYVGPDNGLFSVLLSRDPEAVCQEIQWKPEFLSRSFHGRDWFAPVAAGLALGEMAQSATVEPEELIASGWPDDLKKIVYIDSYGNAITGIRSSAVSRSTKLVAGGQVLGIAKTFSEVPPGQAFWYENSNGLVEVAVNQGRADQVLDIKVGDELDAVTVS